MLAQQELFEPSTYIDYQGPGYFSILTKPTARARQQSYETTLLPKILPLLDPAIDTWITQAVFDQANRRRVNLRSVGLCFADLDTYHCKGLVGKKPEEQAALLNLFCSNEGIPAPSLILFSGRGLQAKWLLDQAIGRSSLPDWDIVQNGLVQILDNFGSDRNAKDVSRVLRLVHTVNTKSGEVVRIVHLSGTPDCPARYAFEDLQEIIRERFPEVKQNEIKRAQPYTAKILQFPIGNRNNYKWVNWNRLCDLQNLWIARGGVPEGMREVTLFWELNFLLLFDPGRNIWKEAQALAGNIEWFKAEIYKSTFSTLYRKAKAHRLGRAIEFQGKKLPELYTPKNQTLISRFKITSEEEREMLTIFSSQEKVRRQREKRRAAGVIPREQFIKESLSNSKPWEVEGLKRSWWYELNKRLEDKTGQVCSNLVGEGLKEGIIRGEGRKTANQTMEQGGI